MTKTFFGACVAVSGIILLTGCQASTTQNNPKEPASLVGQMQKDIDTAVEQQNAKNREAKKIIDDEQSVSHRNHSSHKTSMNTIPQDIDMALAQTCTGATMTTNKGAIVLEFYNTDAPVTVANFCTLAKKGFYDGVIFHRVIKGFMIQGGDPDGTGMGGPGYQFDDEIHANNKNMTGTIAMANAGPGTNGSQFFINTKDNHFLDTKHTVFGKVVKGMNVVEMIEDTQTGMNNKPVEDIVIESIAIVE